MFISKRGKKLLSVMATLAIIMTGLVISPKTTSAETDPSVSVLGATLRLDNGYNSNGTQAMRVAIKVSQADKVKACAIDLTVNGKTLRIATNGDTSPTDGTGVYLIHNNLYSKNESDKSVVYAVTLNNIPSSAFGTSVGITGRIKMLDNTDTTWTSDNNISAVCDGGKNVNGIVTALQANYPDLKIAINSTNGIIYKNVNGNSYQSKLTAADITNYLGLDTDPNINPNELDFNTATFPYGQGLFTLNSDNMYVVSKNIDGQDPQSNFSIKLNKPVKANETIKVIVYGTNSGANLQMALCTMSNSSTQNSSLTKVEMENEQSLTNGSTESDALYFTDGEYGRNWGKIAFKKIVVITEGDEVTETPEPEPTPETSHTPEVTATPDSNSYTLDLSATKDIGRGAKITFDSASGVCKITGTSGDNSNISEPVTIPLSKAIEPGESVKVILEGEQESGGNDARVGLSKNSSDFDYKVYETTNSLFGTTDGFILTNNTNNTLGALIIGHNNNSGIKPFTIKKITITKVTE